MKKLLMDYVREEAQCNYADVYDYFKDLSLCDYELQAKYLFQLFMYILEQEQLEANNLNT